MKKFLALLALWVFSSSAFGAHGTTCFYGKSGNLIIEVPYCYKTASEDPKTSNPNAIDTSCFFPILSGIRIAQLDWPNQLNLNTGYAFGGNAYYLDVIGVFNPQLGHLECPQQYIPDCDQGNCAIQLSKTFDFDVQMGGVKADMYVCEVGFNQLCPTCNQHYLTVDTGTFGKITTHQTFTQANAPSKASVYINDLFFGAEFYVKYCVKTKRLIVGDELAPYTAVVTPSVSIWTGLYQGTGANDYATISNLGANVYEDCSTNLVDGGNSSQGTLLTTNGFAFSDTSTSAVTLNPGTIESCGEPGCDKKQCVYTIKFSEQATCYRPMKCVGGECKPYESTIHTKFDASVDFNCDSGICIP